MTITKDIYPKPTRDFKQQLWLTSSKPTRTSSSLVNKGGTDRVVDDDDCADDDDDDHGGVGDDGNEDASVEGSVVADGHIY